MTILPRHAAIIAELRGGIVTVTQEDSSDRQFKISGGLVECARNRLTLLCDTVEGYSK
jgi:F0F1-type ATP synthase epsilon subunit